MAGAPAETAAMVTIRVGSAFVSDRLKL